MKKWLRITLLVIFCCVFLVSGFMLCRYFINSRQQAKQYQALADLRAEARKDPDAQTLITVTDEKTQQTVQYFQEFAELYRLNSHLSGWLEMPAVGIDYPVMQTPDSPNFYLKRDFYKKKSSHGCLYIHEGCDLTLPTDNIIIYGHHMRDGSMFGSLKKLEKKAFWEEHPVFTFSTLTSRQEYEIFAVFRTTVTEGKGFDYYKFTGSASQEDFDAYVAQCKQLALYDTGITPTYGQQLITLSTCEYSQANGRLVVVARAVTNEGENP